MTRTPSSPSGDDVDVTRELLSLDDRTLEALLSGREVNHEPRLSAFTRQLLLSREVEVVVPSVSLAALLLDGLPAAQLHPAPAAPAGGTPRWRFRPALALPALLSGAAVVVLLAASQNALPAPAQTAVADVVEAVTPLHVPRPAEAPLPVVGSPDPAPGSTGSTPDLTDQPPGSATTGSGEDGARPEHSSAESTDPGSTTFDGSTSGGSRADGSSVTGEHGSTGHAGTSTGSDTPSSSDGSGAVGSSRSGDGSAPQADPTTDGSTSDRSGSASPSGSGSSGAGSSDIGSPGAGSESTGTSGSGTSGSGASGSGSDVLSTPDGSGSAGLSEGSSSGSDGATVVAGG